MNASISDELDFLSELQSFPMNGSITVHPVDGRLYQTCCNLEAKGLMKSRQLPDSDAIIFETVLA